jgi:predicted transposase YdaD
MANSTIHQPHDKLFKLSLKRKASALAFLRHHAPPELLEEVAIATLALKDASFITEEYKELESDVVYGVHTKHGKGYLYFLLEHQTKEDKYMPARLLGYISQLMHLHLKQESDGKLPEVYSLVLYAGGASYKGPKSLDEAFARDGAMQRMGAHVYLIDLVRIANTELLKHGEVALTELALKEGRRDPKAFFGRYYKLISKSRDGHVVLFYLLSYLQGEDKRAFVEEVAILTPKEKSYVMNVLQQERQEGKLEGKLEGRQEGKHQRELDIARKMRKLGATAEFITKATGLKPKDLEPKS